MYSGIWYQVYTIYNHQQPNGGIFPEAWLGQSLEYVGPVIDTGDHWKRPFGQVVVGY